MLEIQNQSEANGLARMLAALLKDNLRDHPERLELLRSLRGQVAFYAEDAEVATTIDFQGDSVVLQDGIVGIPDLTIRGEAECIVELSRSESIAGFPNPLGPVNRSLWKAWEEGRLRIHGLPWAIRLLWALGQVLKVGN
ncbi:MAG: SCP2 sterol-binding domain-containing protein [Sandaracinaceae bacterium]|nr:SCP2 sterol-binding domain-containing protein [Sandaracinaceae bacterium]MDW8245491.1 hypothetical protein [Sandaracinaceae bacterium]